MSTRGRDTAGEAVAVGLGVVLGVILLTPTFPDGTLPVPGSTPDAVGTALLAAAFAVLLVPVGMFALYQVFFLVDR